MKNISEHPPLFLNDYYISEVDSTDVLGFTFDSTLTWQDYIAKMLTRWKQQLGQLYRCHNFFSSYDLSILYKSWIRPAMELGVFCIQVQRQLIYIVLIPYRHILNIYELLYISIFIQP